MKNRSQIESMLLDNKVGLTDPNHIAEAETLFMTLAAAEGMPKGQFDLRHLQELHFHLFRDMYPWAGQVSPDIDASHTSLASETLRTFSCLDTSELTSIGLATFLADKYADLLVFNPFDHGGSRAIRSMIELFAQDCGMRLDWGLYPAGMLKEAVTRANHGDSQILREIFVGMISHRDLFSAVSEDGVALKTAEIFQAAGLSESVVKLQAVIDGKAAASLLRSLSQSFGESIIQSHKEDDPLMHKWDRTSTHSQISSIDLLPEPECKNAERTVRQPGPRQRY